MKIQVDGKSAYYGTGSGSHTAGARTIVFIHGAGFDHAVWVMQARYFARHGFNVIALDLPAHGRSDGPALTSIEAMAQWVLSLVDGLHAECSLGAVTLVGHSMGSLVAMSAANLRSLSECEGPALEKLVLLGTSAPMPVGPPLLDAAEDNDHAAIDMANTWSHSARGQWGASEVPGISNYNSGQRWIERMADGVYHADLAACNAFTPTLDIGEVEVLVIAGSEDRMTPLKSGKALQQSIPGSQLYVLAGSGHAMMSEQPNEVLNVLSTFIDRVTSNTPNKI